MLFMNPDSVPDRLPTPATTSSLVGTSIAIKISNPTLPNK
ncbi:hypothetical protein CCACVL1_03567 [Corchorus capsularis]|uniref:Uncharacterized protein n=1 Tax=Corchorus capsularis TaxID=210143 RepID=A0A1R3JYH7_COCAP|nr:hypothetical protein CCACVL1_03567 [Corchorus capsularis]